MAAPEVRKKLSNALKNSEKFRKAIEEGRAGGGSHEYTPEIRTKISQSLKKYYEENTINIENHRKAMANAVGKKVYQYGLDGKFIKSHESIKSASRELAKNDGVIRQALDKSNRTGGGFLWKTTGPVDAI